MMKTRRCDDLLVFLANQNDIRFSYFGRRSDIDRIEQNVADHYDMILAHISENNLVRSKSAGSSEHLNVYEELRSQFLLIGDVFILRESFDEVLCLDASDVRFISDYLKPFIAGDIIFTSIDYSWCIEIKMGGSYIMCVSPKKEIASLIRKYGLSRRQSE